jgi:anhydro-N-acetylmuramic acid kinase
MDNIDSKPNLYAGLISGTSRDGVDAALIQFTDDQPELISTLCVTYPVDLADQLNEVIETRQRPDPPTMESLDIELAEFFAISTWGLLHEAGVKGQEVTAIGSHGQTVWHNPDGLRPESIQLGAPQRIADLIGACTVGEFRRADIDAGGQGAPLAPLLHKALFQPDTGCTVVLNLGGIANVSVLEASGSVSGFDTGPGNCLLDGWIKKHHDSAYDADGEWASGGSVDENLLRLLLADPYLAKPAPKSTGVEHFNLEWLQATLDRRKPDQLQASPRDIQATLAELTACTVVDSIATANPSDLLVCGGGAHNGDLVTRLKRRLPDTSIASTASRGLPPDWVEAVLFAWLARERLAGRLQDTPPITGARDAVLLGEIFHPRSHGES